MSANDAQPDSAIGPTQAFVMADQRQRWELGERILLESYLQRFPDWRPAPAELLDLIYHEVLVREGHGGRPALAEYVERFPALAEELHVHFEVHTALTRPDCSPPDYLTDATAPPGYALLGVLGSGGMGIVYKARQISLGRIVALKMTAHPGEAAARLLTEARAAAALAHPHIVPIYEVGTHEGRPFFSMEYVDGGSLAPRLRQTPWPGRLAAEVTECLARAIHTAHLRDIVHRDLKPANILLQPLPAAARPPGSAFVVPSGTAPVVPKISDFGLAKLLDQEQERTRSGLVVGTPSYMAPEQVRREFGPIGPATDVHALGALLYEMVTGLPPFRGETVLGTLDQVVHKEPLSPRRLQPAVPRDLETICLKCLYKTPARRYESAAALADDLRRFLNGAAIQARAMGRLQRGWRWCRRRPATAAIIATAIVVVTGAAIAGLETHLWLRSEHERAVRAEQQALAKLRQAHLVQARLARLSTEAGKHDSSLEMLQDAAHLQPGLDLRNEAIAWLARPDWEMLRQWEADPAVANAAFTPDLYRYARYEPDGFITVRRSRDDKELARLALPQPHAPPRQIGFSPDGHYVGVQCHVAANVVQTFVWDWGSAKQVLCSPATADGITLTFAPDSRSIATAVERKTIVVHELPSAKVLKQITAGIRVNQLAFAADGQHLAASSVVDRDCEVYELAAGTCVCRLANPEGSSGVGWSHDGKYLAVGSIDGQLFLWDVTQRRLLATLAGHRGVITSCAFELGDQRIVTGSWDATCRWWDPITRQCVLQAPGSHVYLTPGGRRFGMRDAERLSVWRRSGPEVCRVLRPQRSADASLVTVDPVLRLDAGPGHLLAVATRAGIHLWDRRAVRVVDFLPLADAGAVRFDPTGQYLAASSRSGVYRWRIRGADGDFQVEAREQLLAPANRSNMQDLAFGPDGRDLLVADPAAAGAWLLDFAEQKPGHALGRHEHVAYLSRSPDGRWAAAGTWQGDGVKVWDVHDCSMVAHFASLRPGAGSARPTFSPDGRYLVVTTQDRCQFIATGTWQVETELEYERTRAVPGPVAYQPHGALLALVRSPGEIDLIDRTTRQTKATLTGPPGLVITDLTFDRDGHNLAVATAHSGVLWWDLPVLRAELQRLGLDWED